MFKNVTPPPRAQRNIALVMQKSIREVPREDIPGLVGRLVAMLVTAAMYRSAEPAKADRLLTAEEAAPLLGLSVDQLKRRARTLPFTKKTGRKTLRFSEQGIARYQRRA